jgi:cell shape-determining protein MreD
MNALFILLQAMIALPFGLILAPIILGYFSRFLVKVVNMTLSDDQKQINTKYAFWIGFVIGSVFDLYYIHILKNYEGIMIN